MIIGLPRQKTTARPTPTISADVIRFPTRTGAKPPANSEVPGAVRRVKPVSSPSKGVAKFIAFQCRGA